MKAEVDILKSDARGRVRYSAARRERVLEEFERSGMSGATFAQYADNPSQVTRHLETEPSFGAGGRRNPDDKMVDERDVRLRGRWIARGGIVLCDAPIYVQSGPVFDGSHREV